MAVSACLLTVVPPRAAAQVTGSFTVGIEISQVACTGVTSTTATISWSTNGDSTSQVFYDTVSRPDDISAYASSTAVDTALTSAHSVSLSGLTAARKYYFRVKSTLGKLAAVSSELSFTTASAGGGGGGGGMGGGAIGGGGGGAPAGPGETNLALYTNSEGVFNMAATASSQDGRAVLTFEKGDKAQTKDGFQLKTVKIAPMDSPPPPPEGWNMVGIPYEFGPAGAVFSPSVTLTLKYDPASLPAGFPERKLVIGWWDGSKWVPLDNCAVDTAAKTVSVEITHFSAYSIIGRASPASISMKGLTVSPEQANVGDTVTVTASAANSGDLAGTVTLTLKVNGTQAGTKEVAVEGGGQATATFEIKAGGAGTYEVEVNGLTGKFTVWVANGPANFTVKSLAVFPSVVEYGNEAIISVIAENNGDAAGTYEVIFQIDGVTVSTQKVDLAPHSSKSVEFNTSGSEPGVRSVTVNGLRTEFVVKPLPAPPEPVPINWLPIAWVLFGISTLGSFIFFRAHGRPQYIPPVPPKVRR